MYIKGYALRKDLPTHIYAPKRSKIDITPAEKSKKKGIMFLLQLKNIRFLQKSNFTTYLA